MRAGAVPLFRAFATAYQQALHTRAERGRDSREGGPQAEARRHDAPAEAAEILHLPEGGSGRRGAGRRARYDKLYAMNDPSKGGSFYLQSKILRAREALDAEIAAGSAKTPLLF